MKHYKPSGGKVKKRLLALVLAMALIVGCLLPVYANGVATMDAGFGVDTQAEGDDLDLAPGINETRDEDGNVIITWGADTWNQWDNEQASPYPDGEQMDPGFAIPTITYRFWLSEKDSFELAAFDAEIASGMKLYDMTRAEYIDLYGPNEGMFSAIHVADGGSLWDNSFKNPTSADAPAGANGTVFAGWYTVDEYGYQRTFTFDAACQEAHVSEGIVHAAESATVDVFAKWSKSAADQAEQAATNPNDDATLDDHTYNKWYAALVSSSDSAFQGLLEQYTEDEDFCDWLDEMPEDEIKYLSERMDETAETLVLPPEAKTETVTLTKGYNYSVTLTGSAGDVSASNHGWTKSGNGSDYISLSGSGNTATVSLQNTDWLSNDTTATVKHTYKYKSVSYTDTFTIIIKADKQERTVRVGGKITLTSTSTVTNGTWSLQNGTTGSATLDNQNGNAVRVTGVSVGTVTVTYTYTTTSSNSPPQPPGGNKPGSTTQTDVYTITVIPAETYEPLYLYALYPELEYTGAGSMNATSNWYGIGIARIKEGALGNWTGTSSIAGATAIGQQIQNGTVDLTPYSGEYTYYRTDGKDETTNTYDGRALYPDLDYNNKTYTYWNGEGNLPEDSYTIEWVELKRANGANAGDHLHYNFPEVSSTTSSELSSLKAMYATHHLDGVIHFGDRYLVKFMTVEPGENTYSDLNPERYTQSKPGTATLSSVVLPESDAWKASERYDVLGETDDHKGWEFSGWYLDAELKTPVSAESSYTTLETIDDSYPTTGDKVVVYYGKWTPKKVEATTVTIKKQVAGLMRDPNKEFTFTVSIQKDNETVGMDKITAKKVTDGIPRELSNFAGSFTLKHDDYVVLSGVPIGATVTITETNASGYEVSSSITGSATYEENRPDNVEVKFAYTVEAATTTDNPNTIVVTNTKNIIPDAGIDLGSATPYLFLLCAGAVGVATLKRKRRS